MAPPFSQQQLQMLLRLPDAIAARVQQAIDMKAEEATKDMSSSPSSSSSVPSPGQRDTASSLEALRIQPDESEGAHTGEDYILSIKMSQTGQEENYPALLANLPCITESHKTQDKNTFYKSNDVGQVLQVFMDVAERNDARNDLRRYGSLGFHGTCNDGLTPPTSQIVPRKYVKTRHVDYGKYSKGELQEIIEEVTLSPLSDGLLNQPEPIVFQTVEEVIDFEDWMITEDMPTGLSFVLEGNEWNKSNVILQAHPEILMTEVSDKNIEIEVKRQLRVPENQKTDILTAEKDESGTKDADGLFGSDEDDSD